MEDLAGSQIQNLKGLNLFKILLNLIMSYQTPPS